MTETALVRCLRLLRDGEQPLTVSEIVALLDEDQSYVTVALQKLGERRVVVRSGQSYRYNKTPANEEFADKMVAVYDRLDRKSEMESVVVGLLCAAAQQRHLVRQDTLLRVLREEGFNGDDVVVLLREEVGRGRVKRLKVAVRKDKEDPFPAPPTLPWHYTSRLVRMKDEEYDRVSRRWVEDGFFVQEEDYLIADFPSTMAGPTAEYVRKERSHLAQRIEDESFQWWVGLRVGCRYFDLD